MSRKNEKERKMNTCCSLSKTPNMICLSGTSRKIGERWGRINRLNICDDLDRQFLALARKQNLTDKDMIDRASPFVDIAAAIAPHWLDEAREIARIADVDPDLYLAYQAGVYRSLHLHEDPVSFDECTSYAVHKRYTEKRAVFFHKNRDRTTLSDPCLAIRARRQCAFIMDIRRKGINKFIALSDASVPACMMMVNEKGLAGSADTGGLKPLVPKYRGMMNTAILRHIAETASCCAEALDIIKQFIKRRWYAGGGSTGTHWLFADRTGRILEVAHDSERVKYRYHSGKVYFSARARSAAARSLQRCRKPVTFHAFHNVSRHPSLCFVNQQRGPKSATSIAGMTVEISPEHPESLTTAWVAMPARNLAFPLLMGGSGTPLCLVDGTLDAIGNQLPENRALWETVEQNVRANAQLLQDSITANIRKETAGRVAARVDAWVLKNTLAMTAMLREMAGVVK